MSGVEDRPTERRSPRQGHVLDSAEACFVRNGFHRTTMVDIAREAGMSQGNFYRYYASKEALILDIAAREAERAGELIYQLASDVDPRSAVEVVLTRYFAEVPRETAILRLDLWAEATRNSAIAALIAEQEREARDWILGGLAESGGSVTTATETSWSALSTLLKGMIVSRALFADYDSRPDLDRLKALMKPIGPAAGR